MHKEEEALRGFMVGEARDLLESQRKIEKKVGVVSIVTLVTLVLILALLVMNTQSFARLKAATSSITAASGSLNDLAKEMRAGIRDSRAEIAALKKRVDNLNSRLGKWENGTASAEPRRETGKVAGSSSAKASSQETTKKKKGCLGIF
jgi:predicted PurR-regulated permease PerM